MTGCVLLVLGAAHAGPLDEVGPSASDRFSVGDAAPVTTRPWWEALDDPALDAVIDQALGGNGDLGAAWARVDQAAGLSTSAGSVLLPAVSANGSYSLTPADVQWFSFGGNPPQPPPTPNAEVADPVPSLRGTVDLRWQLDLFGRSVLTWRAARYDKLAAQGDSQALALTISARVADAWYDHALAAERLAVVAEQVSLNRDLLEVVRLRYGADATALDLLQQRQQLASTEARLPGATAGVAFTRQRLAVLLGEDPRTWTVQPGSLPEAVGETPSVGTPAELARNRPDLRAATARVEAAHRRKLSAHRGLLPQLSASAQWGRQSTTVFSDSAQEGPVETYGVGVTVPLFQGGRQWGEVRQTSAATRGAVQSWHQTWIAAVQDVEGALAAEVQTRDALAAQRAQFEAADLAYDEARREYLDGVRAFLNVQSALATRQAAELTLLQARRDLVGSRIQLHEAVAGPWTSSLSPPARGGS